MASRLLITGKNNTMPLDAAQAMGGGIAPRYRICEPCEGTGYLWGYHTINPSEKPHKYTCDACDGDGAFERAA